MSTVCEDGEKVDSLVDSPTSMLADEVRFVSSLLVSCDLGCVPVRAWGRKKGERAGRVHPRSKGVRGREVQGRRALGIRAGWGCPVRGIGGGEVRREQVRARSGVRDRGGPDAERVRARSAPGRGRRGPIRA
ncbi:hypothetical protein Droror1_Dr00000112, partial [Drosera rotundifolia]